jgi:hypothetical protein
VTRKVFLVGLEPLEERYTGQWARWLPETFAELGEVHVIEGKTLGARIESGAFLDTYSSAHYKATQLARIASLFHTRQVRDGDLFWFSDVEYPGMESVRYLARLSGLRVGVFAFQHAGSYTRSDLMARVADVGRFAEVAWVSACDGVMFGSQYHLARFVEQRLRPLGAGELAERCVVTGNPFRPKEVQAAAGLSKALPWNRARKWALLYPHRPDVEKRLLTFARWAEQALEHDPDLTIAFTTGRVWYEEAGTDAAGIHLVLRLRELYPERVGVFEGLKREAFYELLGDARITVSTTIEENFGYAMAEAIAAGSLPFMPDRYSHRELWPGTVGLYRGVLEWGQPAGEELCRLCYILRPGQPPRADFEGLRLEACARMAVAEARIVEAIRTRCEEVGL